MKILVVGSGGREHALVWKLKQSSKVDTIYCAPGNGGIAELAECVSIGAEDIDGLLAFVVENAIDLTVVGPEVPLTMGIVDRFREKGLKAFGPTAAAAELEGSKAFSKMLMQKYGIPTAAFEIFTKIEEALEYLSNNPAPIVIKASGLAAGKGAIVCMTDQEARDAVNSIMTGNEFGEAGKTVVIEEFMTGEELSVFALTDGKDYVLLPSSQDHKAVFDGDKGPNTGGMGAYAPAPIASESLLDEIGRIVIQPVIDAMAEEEAAYTGLLYAGLMITEEEPKVVEFNCRFGDPETQAVLPLVYEDLVDLFLATIDGTIANCSVSPAQEYAVCVIIASGGYPGSYEKGKVIAGLDTIRHGKRSIVFHAGTKLEDGKLFTNGGRVLCMTSINPDIQDAQIGAYNLVDSVSFEKMYYRNDIAQKGIKRLLG